MDIRKIKKLIEKNQASPNWKFLKAKSLYASAVPRQTQVSR